MKKVLITGGCGFIGLHVSSFLNERGIEVRIIDNLSSTTPRHLEKLRSLLNVEIMQGSILDNDVLQKAFEGVSHCVHLAFPTSLCNRDFDKQFSEVAAQGTLNVLECCRTHNVKIIYGSSISVYGVPEQVPITEQTPVRPLLVYGSNKYLGELYTHNYHQLYNLEYAILRIGDTFGSYDNRRNAITNFIDAVQRGENITLNNDGTTVRSYVYAPDVAAVIHHALTGITNQTVNVVNSDSISLLALAHEIVALSGKSLHVTPEMSVKDLRNYTFDSTRLSQLFPGFTMQSIKASLHQYYHSL
jgi:UDP-glucose 4-epimerase